MDYTTQRVLHPPLPTMSRSWWCDLADLLTQQHSTDHLWVFTPLHGQYIPIIMLNRMSCNGFSWYVYNKNPFNPYIASESWHSCTWDIYVNKIAYHLFQGRRSLHAAATFTNDTLSTDFKSKVGSVEESSRSETHTALISLLHTCHSVAPKLACINASFDIGIRWTFGNCHWHR
jgi:hypothetical protein